MTVLYAIGAGLAVLLAVYLAFAMLVPERFE